MYWNEFTCLESGYCGGGSSVDNGRVQRAAAQGNSETLETSVGDAGFGEDRRDKIGR